MNCFNKMPRIKAYTACGNALGMVGVAIGVPLTQDDVKRWSTSMHKLATADVMSEEPCALLQAGQLLEVLGISREHPMLMHSAEGLLAADRASRSAESIQRHISSRVSEGECSFGLLRYQADCADQNNLPWGELRKLSVLGVLLDTLDDRHEDAHTLPFSPQLIANHALRAIFKVSATIHPQTYRAVIETGVVCGDVAYAATKPVRVIAGTLVASKRMQ